MFRFYGRLVLATLLCGCVSSRTEPAERIVRLVPVRCVAADALSAELLKEPGFMGSDATTISVDPRTSFVVFNCASEQSAERWRTLQRIGDLDEQARARSSGQGICHPWRRIYMHEMSLKFASAASVVRTIEELCEAGTRAHEESRGCVPSMPGMVTCPVAPDVRDCFAVAIAETNSVNLCAYDETDLSRLVELVARLDEDAGRSH